MPAVLVPGVVHGVVHPGRSAEPEILEAVHGGEMIVGVAFLQEGAHLLRPGVVAEEAVLVGEVPHHIREGGKARRRVAVETPLVFPPMPSLPNGSVPGRRPSV